MGEGDSRRQYQARVTLTWLAVSPALFLNTIAFFRIQYKLG
jgi:hypothetical protein